jgi:hypothetical protein
MMKGKSEFAARFSFQFCGWAFSGWRNFGRRGRRDSWLGHPLSACMQQKRVILLVIRLNLSRNVMPTGKILFEVHKLFRHSAENPPGIALRTGDLP